MTEPDPLAPDPMPDDDLPPEATATTDAPETENIEEEGDPIGGNFA
jgi:hypothetical protein